MKTAVKFVMLMSLAGLLTIGLLVFFGSCNGCGTTPVPNPPPGPTPITDAAPPARDDCDLACNRGAVLGCAWAAPTALGATCADVCRNAQYVLPWNTACIITASSCSASDNCQLR